MSVLGRWTLAVGLAAVMAAGTLDASGQSLGDAAARAREQRSANAGTLSLSDRDLAAGLAAANREALSLNLTLPVLDRYMRARTSLLRVMVQAPDVARRVLEAVGTAGQHGVEGLEREYSGIPEAREAVQAANMPMHDYVVTEVAFMAAVGVLAGKLQLAVAPTGTIGTNVEFLKQHEQDVAGMSRESLVLEAQIARQLTAPGSSLR